MRVTEQKPRAAIRQGFAAGHLDEADCETLLDALGKTNLLSHAYRKVLALEAETLITTCSFRPGTTLHHPASRPPTMTDGLKANHRAAIIATLAPSATGWNKPCGSAPGPWAPTPSPQTWTLPCLASN